MNCRRLTGAESFGEEIARYILGISHSRIDERTRAAIKSAVATPAGSRRIQIG